MKYIVKYQGKFGFIKPWESGRDSYTKTSFFLYKSSLMGIEKKLFPELHDEKDLCKIKRYRIDFDFLSKTQEVTRSAMGKKTNTKYDDKQLCEYQSSIVERSVMVNPVLFLLFDNKDDANIAMNQHICLSRNEDVMLPINLIEIDDIQEFDQSEKFSGYEMEFFDDDSGDVIYCGYNKYTGKKQYGVPLTFGTPTQER